MTAAFDYASKAEGIFVISDSFIRIKDLVDNEDSVIDEIVAVIQMDPALASSVLKLANSSFFNFSSKVDTVSKGVSLLGIDEIYNLSVAYFMSRAFKGAISDTDFLNRFWEHSVDCALLVTFFAEKFKYSNPERLYILGLLHNIGELVIYQMNPEAYKSCISEDINVPCWEKQKSVLGFTYADVSSELLQHWKLPFTIADPIRLQNKEDVKGNYPEAQLLYIAKRIMMHNQIFSDEPIESLLSAEILEATGITKEDLEDAKTHCGLERLSLLSLLNPDNT